MVMGLHTEDDRWAKVWVLTRRPTAGGEGVANIALRAATDGVVVDNITLGTDAANPNTGVETAEVDTGKAGSTLAVDDTLGPAGWRSSVIAWQAGTDWSALLLPTVGVRSTRRRLARVGCLHRIDHSGDEGALGEGISGVAFVTLADCVVV